MLRTHRSLLAFICRALCAMSLAPLAPLAAGAQTVVDNGKFIISRNNARVGTETFAIMRASEAGGLAYRVDATQEVGNRMVKTVLTTDAVGSLLGIDYGVFEGGNPSMQYKSSRGGNRLTTSATTVARDAATKEVLLAPGTLFLDDEILHPYYFFALGGPRSVSFVSPLTSTQGAVTVQALGLESVTVADGSSTTGTHFSIRRSATDRRDVWINGAKQLLKVEIPGQGLVAVRERLPK
jgi:hypothetical protein